MLECETTLARLQKRGVARGPTDHSYPGRDTLRRGGRSMMCYKARGH